MLKDMPNETCEYKNDLYRQIPDNPLEKFLTIIFFQLFPGNNPTPETALALKRQISTPPSILHLARIELRNCQSSNKLHGVFFAQEKKMLQDRYKL